jgi:hypothetical protein
VRRECIAAIDDGLTFVSPRWGFSNTQRDREPRPVPAWAIESRPGWGSGQHPKHATFFDQSQFRKLDARWSSWAAATTSTSERVKKPTFAEGGDRICVSNFPDAILDRAIKSTDNEDQGLLFEASTERFPPRGTEVTMELVPRAEKAGEE